MEESEPSSLLKIGADDGHLSVASHPGPHGRASPRGQPRERLVRSFIRHLLRSLAELHSQEYAHLDLRPETILLRDGRLVLADFGHSRRLEGGVIAGETAGNPEFVSPEMVRGQPLTLATDMWSLATITFMLLTGVSPFHGDNDSDTLWNVSQGAYVMTDDEWSDFTPESRDFIRQLFFINPRRRMTAREAQSHPWLADHPEEEDEPLNAECLREFKYTHKWLDRRVFVLQTPSEQEIAHLEHPSTSLAEPSEAGQRMSQPASAHLPRSAATPSAPAPNSNQNLPPIRVPLDDFGRLVRLEDLLRIAHDDWGRPLDRENGPPVDFQGNPLPKLNKNLLRNIPPEVAEKLREAREAAVQPPASRRNLQPQQKGEAPAAALAARSSPQPRPEQPSEEVPLRMIRGERRQIEEEIANRILSDISEENSIAGSLASLDEIEDLLVRPRQLPEPILGSPEESSRSSTPLVESDASTPTLTMLNNPNGTDHPFNPAPAQPPEESTSLSSRPEPYPYNTQVLTAAESDPSIPVGAPLFIEGLGHQQLVIDTRHVGSRNSLSPRVASPRRIKPGTGTKSPILLSPGKEHQMEVVIATKRGKPSFLPPDQHAPEIDDEDANFKDRQTKAKEMEHKPEFEDDSKKKKTKPAPDDLDKYRPKNFYPEIDSGPEYDIDDSPWDSHYQIGPDTYLMATRGPAFNARVRDYRRELFGDGAPLVSSGYLGYRNADVSVRERRRYTDILREQSSGGKESTVNDQATAIHRNPSSSAIERIKEDIKKTAPSATKKNGDGTFAPIFSSRLKDTALVAGAASAVFECRVVGQPQPEVTWWIHEQAIVPDSRHAISFEKGIARLVILLPLLSDLGIYSCSANNQFGSDKTSARLVSGDTPSRPGRPDIQLSSDTELFITWEAPEGPPLLDGLVYKLEYRPASDTDYSQPWLTLSDQMEDEAVVVKHLDPLGIYQFRVRARNSFGLGEPSLTSRIVRTHQRGAPKLQIDILKGETRLTVVSPPQVKKGKALEGISEESEESEADNERESVHGETASLSIHNEDPRTRFQLEGLISKSAISVVRSAVDKKTEIGAHCMCIIREDNDFSRQEVEFLATCQHENVAHLIASYSHSGLVFSFCERLHEDIFSRFTFLDSFTEEHVALVARQIAAGLHWLHFKGVAHLSVSPHSVHFTSKRSWVVRITDFTYASEIGDNSWNPKKFDQNWAPPEFYVEGSKVTGQSDVWGMGTILFCLLGGFHPFTSEYDTYDEIKENVLKVKCDPNLIPVQASQEALSFVTWALKKSTLRRMRTDEALSHRFLSADPSMVRRRESIKYPSSRLRKTAYLTRAKVKDPESSKLKEAVIIA